MTRRAAPWRRRARRPATSAAESTVRRSACAPRQRQLRGPARSPRTRAVVAHVRRRESRSRRRASWTATSTAERPCRVAARGAMTGTAGGRRLRLRVDAAAASRVVRGAATHGAADAATDRRTATGGEAVPRLDATPAARRSRRSTSELAVARWRAASGIGRAPRPVGRRRHHGAASPARRRRRRHSAAAASTRPHAGARPGAATCEVEQEVAHRARPEVRGAARSQLQVARSRRDGDIAQDVALAPVVVRRERVHVGEQRATRARRARAAGTRRVEDDARTPRRRPDSAGRARAPPADRAPPWPRRRPPALALGSAAGSSTRRPRSARDSTQRCRSSRAAASGSSSGALVGDRVEVADRRQPERDA